MGKVSAWFITKSLLPNAWTSLNDFVQQLTWGKVGGGTTEQKNRHSHGNELCISTHAISWMFLYLKLR